MRVLHIVPSPESAHELEVLLDYQLKKYRANLDKFTWNLQLNAIIIVVTILLIVRRSDSLTILDNSIPLSWLHFLVPAVLIYLWIGFGFTLGDLIWGRIHGYELITALHRPTTQYQKELFEDAGFIDGWFRTFVDKNKSGNGDYTGIQLSFGAIAAFMVLLLGNTVAMAHASALAILPIGCRRYLRTASNRWLYWYYLLPLVPLAVFLSSHLEFAYGGENRNWIQLYIAIMTFPLMAGLMWLSTIIDARFHPESVHCLRRQRHQVYPDASGALSSLEQMSGDRNETTLRTVSLIGDSLSTGFHLASPPSILIRLWTAWKKSWFLDGPTQDQAGLGIGARLNALGPIKAVSHASVTAGVDGGNRRTMLDRALNRWHFSHQVDELLAGSFPDMVLIWIGHNNVDWKSRTNSCTAEAFNDLSDAFAKFYQVQLRRLLKAALDSGKPVSVVVFGLINFEAFFQARAEAERRKHADERLFPYLETAYRTFVSMKPEYREGMIRLAQLYNKKLRILCGAQSENLKRTNVSLVYSEAMSLADIARSEFLSTIDAWHPSALGRRVLADCAYPSVHEQACFLGWTSGLRGVAHAAALGRDDTL